MVNREGGGRVRRGGRQRMTFTSGDRGGMRAEARVGSFQADFIVTCARKLVAFIFDPHLRVLFYKSFHLKS